MDYKKYFTRKNIITWGIPIVIIILAFFIPVFSNNFATKLIYFLPYMVLSVAYTMFSGTTGYVSLASAAFYGVGIYAAALFGEQIPFIFVILLGAAASFILAFLVGSITLRLRGIYFSMFTFGLLLLMKEVIWWYELTIQNVRGYFVVIQSNTTIYFYLLGIFVVTMLVAYLLKKSKFGLALSSIGENEDASDHIGVNVTMVKVLTYAVSATFMGAAGAVMATKLTYIDPVIAFDPMNSFAPALMATFGGVGNIWGPVLGAVVFYYIQQELQTGQLRNYYKIIFGAVLVATIMYLPSGIIGLIQKIQKRISGVKRAPTAR
jgi:branched-chain amino acid transport system permease protein